jgi:hypothetical protein
MKNITPIILFSLFLLPEISLLQAATIPNHPDSNLKYSTVNRIADITNHVQSGENIGSNVFIDKKIAISQANSTPSVYLGTWAGQGNQNNNTSWSISLSIVSGTIGSVVGKIDYPSLNCGGEWTLQRVTKNSIELLENLSYGMDRCVDRGTYVLKLSSARKLNFHWLNPSGKLEATGMLRKVSSDRR